MAAFAGGGGPLPRKRIIVNTGAKRGVLAATDPMTSRIRLPFWPLIAFSSGRHFAIPRIYQMKNRLLFLTAVFALAFAPAVRAQDAKSDEPETELGAKMEKISSAWRVAKRQLADPSKNPDTLAKLAIVKENMVASAKLEPDLKKSKPAEEQAKFVADYQAKMKEEIKKIDEIIALVKAGKNDEAAKLVGVVDQDQKDAHKQFKKAKKKQ